MVALFDAAVFAVAPLVPVATARNFDAPAAAANCKVMVSPDSGWLVGVISDPHVVPPSVDCCTL